MTKKIITEVLRVLITALATGLGLTIVNGCAFVPLFAF